MMIEKSVDSYRSVLIASLFVMTIGSAKAQNGYNMEKDIYSGVHIYNGIISDSLLRADSTFGWYAQQTAGYHPAAASVEKLKEKNENISFIVFMGTWCEDSQNVIPKFYQLLHAADFDPKKVTLFGVDKQKVTKAFIAQSFGITNVPTIIAMKDGKEIGRVVEYGSTGNYEDDFRKMLEM